MKGRNLGGGVDVARFVGELPPLAAASRGRSGRWLVGLAVRGSRAQPNPARQQVQAQMESLLSSMTPEMRQQLEDMVDSIFGDSQFQWEMAQLGANLERIQAEPRLKSSRSMVPASGLRHQPSVCRRRSSWSRIPASIVARREVPAWSTSTLVERYISSGQRTPVSSPSVPAYTARWIAYSPPRCRPSS